MKNKKIDKLFTISILLISVILYFIPTGFENPYLTENKLYEKAKVISVDNSGLKNYSIVTVGEQKLSIKIKKGKFKGKITSAQNILLGQKKIDKIYKKGDNVLSIIHTNTEGNKITETKVADYYRTDYELLLFICFAIFLLFFSKFAGLKAIISFLFTAFMLWKILLPSLLNGYSPIIISCLIVCICCFVIIFLVAGINKRGLVAFLGAILGVFITTILAISFGHFFNVSGTTQDYSESLLYAGFTNLNLSEIVISIIFISSTGAVMDVAMDISSSLNEISEKVDKISSKELITSGFNISSPIIGSMTTTLLFAYSGTLMFAFMAFMAKGEPLISIINKNFISTEILHTLVGSFGLVLVAPLTSIVGGIILSNKKTNIL